MSLYKVLLLWRSINIVEKRLWQSSPFNTFNSSLKTMTPSQAYEVIIFILNKIFLNRLYVHVGPHVTFIRSGHVNFMCNLREKSWYIMMMFMNSISNTVYYYTSRNWDWMIFFIQIYNVSILMAYISELSFYFWKMTFYMHSA